MSVRTGQSAYSLCLLLSDFPLVFDALYDEVFGNRRKQSFLERREASREQRIRRMAAR